MYDEVYIQGSSIKGALVNLLIVDYIINNRNEFLDEKKKILDLAYSSVDEKSIRTFKSDVKKIVKNIEKKIFYNENRNFEKTKKIGISISDSYKNHTEIKTNFYQDIDEKRKDGKETCMPIIRECIMPKNKFDFDITLDFEVLDESKLEIRNYDDLISGNILQSLKISCLAKNAFQEYAKAEGKLGGQNKIPRLANDRKIAEILEKFKEMA